MSGEKGEVIPYHNSNFVAVSTRLSLQLGQELYFLYLSLKGRKHFSIAVILYLSWYK